MKILKKKILHIVDEFSLKNISIVSLVLFLSDMANKYSYKSRIYTFSNKLFTENKDLINLNNNNFFYKIFYLFNCIKVADVIHIHGYWRFLQFISICICVFYKKKFHIHPHGMFNAPAIFNKGFIFSIFKFIYIFLINIFFQKKISFICITKEECLMTSSFYSNSKIQLIPNPILQKENYKLPLCINKSLIFMGRFHPIKNLDLLVKSFINSNLNSTWKLYIYGLPDDYKYEQKILSLSKDHKNIIFKKPVFGKKKQKVISKAWGNILLSQSEVLSLSVLESSFNNLPSIVSKSIQIPGFIRNGGVTTDLKICSITNAIRKITRWTINERLKRGKQVKKFIVEKFSTNKIIKLYLKLYEKNFSNSFKNIESQYFSNSISKNIPEGIIFSLTYMINFFIPSMYLILLILNGMYVIGAEIAVFISSFIALTQMFSGNARAIFFKKNNIKFLKQNLNFRLSLNLFFILILLFITNLGLVKNIDYLRICFLISCLVLVQWTCELFIAYEEKKKEYFFFFKYFFIHIILFVIAIFSIISTNLILIEISLVFYIIFCFYICVIISKKIKIRFITFLSIKNLTYTFKQFLTLPISSSFLYILSSVFWRVYIFNFVDKIYASILFVSFSISSFPATIINTAIGPVISKYKITDAKLSFLKYFSFFIFIISIIYFNFLTPLSKNIFFIKTINYSLLGAVFMSIAMYYRQLKIKNIKKPFLVFKWDIFYGFGLIMLLPLIHIYFGWTYLSYLFLISSIYSLLIYKYLIR